jgi:uncharacterized membrane protein
MRLPGSSETGGTVSHWAPHPHVRTGGQLTFGERAADKLKATFGSWAFLMILNGFIVAWIAANLIAGKPFDPYPFILLNLGLSWLAAQQGGALQIAANRGDRIASEVALGTHKNSEELLDLNRVQLEILTKLDGLDSKVADLAAAVQVVMAARTARAAKTPSKEAP